MDTSKTTEPKQQTEEESAFESLYRPTTGMTKQAPRILPGPAPMLVLSRKSGSPDTRYVPTSTVPRQVGQNFSDVGPYTLVDSVAASARRFPPAFRATSSTRTVPCRGGIGKGRPAGSNRNFSSTTKVTNSQASS